MYVPQQLPRCIGYKVTESHITAGDSVPLMSAGIVFDFHLCDADVPEKIVFCSMSAYPSYVCRGPAKPTKTSFVC